MDGLSLIVAVMPTVALVALCAGMALTSIGARKPRAQKPGASRANAVEYLYVPCARSCRDGSSAQTHRWVQEVPIVKKTATLIYYASDSWNWRAAVVSPGCISRELFEADTRRRNGYPPGVIPVPGSHRTGSAGRLFYATRQAAENALDRGDCAQAGSPPPRAPLINELRRIMLDAHPDRGGTADQFIRAHRRYQAALGQARR